MHRMGYKGWVLVVALFCFVLLMAACSAAPKTEQSQSNIEQSTATNGEGADEAATSTETGTDTYPRTIQTARGIWKLSSNRKKLHWLTGAK
ncbi:hypothetical protein [Paenibacillus sp. DCT19]|uniref:hypothetical protein n=1 Tax=Paenibacillus sp. DCT19 TaxID=2211212 RepID=UPI0020C1E774|nr:hypothetical protein [Paenibacillus sp. DCT19]